MININDDIAKIRTIKLPKPNFTMAMGEKELGLIFEFRVRKTKVNMIKYWLFCQFFPFRITRWDND